MKEKYDVIIVGAGPAGLRCAKILADNNQKVLVLEKNKIIGPKVCAGGLTLKDLDLGIPDKIIQRKFKKIIFKTPLQTSEIKSDKPFIATILRKDLGRWMAKKAEKAGAKIKTSSEVTKIDKKSIIINNKLKINYDYLIGADGSNSFVRKYLGIKNERFLQAFHYLPRKKFNNLELLALPDKFGHYIWIFPYKNFASVGTLKDVSKDNKAFSMNMVDLREHFDCWCREKFDIKKCKFEAAIINYDYKGYEFGNIFLIGDAAGLASGLTGEGIYNAIKSGEDVANKILNKNYNCKNIAHMLHVKKVEEELLKAFEINKTLSKIELELFNSLLKTKLIGGEVINLID